MTERDVQLKATGRRKTSVAIVCVTPGTGQFSVNGRPFDQYFKTEALRVTVSQPLTVSGGIGKFDVAAKVRGGGITGQAGAMRHGLARALAKVSDEARAAVKQAGFLTRDQRMKERKKYGRAGARKRFQFSKR